MFKTFCLKIITNKDIPAATLGIGGFILGLLFLLSWSKESIQSEFQHLSAGKPEPLLWVLLISAQVGMWFILTTSLAQSLQTYRNVARLRRLGLLCIIVSALMMLSILMLIKHYPDAETLVRHQDKKVRILTLIGAIPFLLSLSGLYLAGAAAEQTSPTSSDFATNARALMKISHDLQTFLVATGLIIGAATIATGVLEKAMGDLNIEKYEESVLYALLYGAFGTGVIIVLYLPAYAALRAAATRLSDSVLPLPADADAIPDWLAKRQKLDDLFGLDKSALESLKTGIAILTPIIAGAGSFIALK